MKNLTINTDTGFYLEGQSALYDLSRPEENQTSTDRLVDFYETLQPVLRPAICFDVGAGAGDHALRLHALLPETQIIAFEGNPIAVEPALKKLSGTDGMLQYLQRVIGKEGGNSPAFICRQNSDGSYSLDKIDDFDPDRVGKARIALDRRQKVYALNIWLDKMTDAPFSLRVTGRKMLYQVLKGTGNQLYNAASLLISIPATPRKPDEWTPYDLITHLAEGGFRAIARDFPADNQYFRMLFVREDHARSLEVNRELEKFLTRTPAPEPEENGKKRKMGRKVKG